jgi:hypothetical protein
MSSTVDVELSLSPSSSSSSVRLFISVDNFPQLSSHLSLPCDANEQQKTAAILALIQTAIKDDQKDQTLLIQPSLSSPFSLSLLFNDSSSRSFSTAHFYLYFLCCLFVILFSSILIFAPSTGAQLFYLLIYFSSSAPSDHSASCQSYTQLFTGVLGAVMIGWMISLILSLYQISRINRIIKNKIHSNSLYLISWLTLSIPLLDWFIIDSTFSLVTNYWQNAVLNSVFLAAFTVPVIGLAPANCGRLIKELLSNEWNYSCKGKRNNGEVINSVEL